MIQRFTWAVKLDESRGVGGDVLSRGITRMWADRVAGQVFIRDIRGRALPHDTFAIGK